MEQGVVPMVQHKIELIRSPISVTARCSCGWSHVETRRQNARARQSKLEAMIRSHERFTSPTAVAARAAAERVEG